MSNEYKMVFELIFLVAVVGGLVGGGLVLCFSKRSDRWLKSFASFHEDMGTRPDNTTLDRLNNNGNYEPVNCEWRTPKDQSNNTRFNHLVTFNGKTHSLAQWEEITGISQRTLYARIVRLHWTVSKALTTEPDRRFSHG